MKQYEAVIKVMEQNGGFATLGCLNQKVLKMPGVEWKTKTPLQVFVVLFKMKDFSSK